MIKKTDFQYQYSSRQCHMILQKPFLYVDLLLRKHFFLVLLNIFVKTVIIFQETLINRKMLL